MPTLMKTYSARPKDIEAKWWIVDATDMVLGRLASTCSMMIRGKHKPMYTPHMDCGDNIIVINAEKIKLTGKKLTNKVYHRHTGHPGGIKETTPAKIIASGYAERILEKAVQRMVSREPLGRAQLKKLKVYKGAEHPHQSQNPEVLDLAARNKKNKRSS